MKLSALALLVPVAAIALTSHAPPAAAQPSMSPVSRPTPAEEIPQAKDPTTATLLALGVTAAGYGLMYAATNTDEENHPLAWAGVAVALVGPSAGHIYAGEYKHAAVTTTVRAGAALAAVAGVVMSICFDSCGERSDENAGAALMLIGGSAYAATLIYDIFDAHRAAKRTNQRRAAAITPTLMATSNGPAPGISLAGSF